MLVSLLFVLLSTLSLHHSVDARRHGWNPSVSNQFAHPSPSQKEIIKEFRQSQAQAVSRHRISPIDGSIIALPTQQQLDWQAQEVSVLIHFNIATYLPVEYDSCGYSASVVPDINLFDPRLIDTQQWVRSIESLGAKYATLVVKHNCGFTTWPTRATFPLTNNQTVPYNYSIQHSPLNTYDVAKSFFEKIDAAGIKGGFYYSVVVNNWLNVQNGYVRDPSTLVPGQLNITDSTYNSLVEQQLTEIWSQYGQLQEVWLDGGYTPEQLPVISGLLNRLQPDTVVFNGCAETGGTVCVSNHSVRWVGTEYGVAPEPNWSMGTTNGGDSQSPIFCPAECDTTLQDSDRWFWGNNTIRSLSELVSVYHTTVGRNCVMELDLTPDRSGLIPARHAARYKQFGDFIRSCYGTPIAQPTSATNSTNDPDMLPGVFIQTYDPPVSIDRVMIQEDQTNGQVIRSYAIFARVYDGGEMQGIIGDTNVGWTLLGSGTSIGNKRIHLFDSAVTIKELRITTTFVDVPVLKSLSVHLCDQFGDNAQAKQPVEPNEQVETKMRSS